MKCTKINLTYRKESKQNHEYVIAVESNIEYRILKIRKQTIKNNN